MVEPGAAVLQAFLTGVRESPGGGFEVSGVLKQMQAGPPLLLEVPVVVQTAGKPVAATVRTDAAATPFAVKADAKPLALVRLCGMRVGGRAVGVRRAGAFADQAHGRVEIGVSEGDLKQAQISGERAAAFLAAVIAGMAELPSLQA